MFFVWLVSTVISIFMASPFGQWWCESFHSIRHGLAALFHGAAARLLSYVDMIGLVAVTVIVQRKSA